MKRAFRERAAQVFTKLTLTLEQDRPGRRWSEELVLEGDGRVTLRNSFGRVDTRFATYGELTAARAALARADVPTFPRTIGAVNAPTRVRLVSEISGETFTFEAEKGRYGDLAPRVSPLLATLRTMSEVTREREVSFRASLEVSATEVRLRQLDTLVADTLPSYRVEGEPFLGLLREARRGTVFVRVRIQGARAQVLEIRTRTARHYGRPVPLLLDVNDLSRRIASLWWGQEVVVVGASLPNYLLVDVTVGGQRRRGYVSRSAVVLARP
jgi:hypothetical protein